MTLPASALYDDFSNSTTMTTLWGSSYGGVTISGGQAVLPTNPGGTPEGAGLASGVQYDMTNSYAQAKVTPVNNANTYCFLAIITDLVNYNGLILGLGAGPFMAGTLVNGGPGTTIFSTTYSPTNHAWWRIRTNTTTAFFDVSANGITWNNVATYAYITNGYDVTNAGLHIFCGSVGAPLGNSFADNFNSNATIVNPASTVATHSGGTFTPVNTIPAVGPRSVAPASTRGNLLLCVAAWNNNSTYVPTPAGAVADDQGNWWRYVGDSGQSATGIRVGAWVCSNSQAVQNWLSFCPQGYSAAFAFHVTEIQGIPASHWPMLDFHVSGGSASGATTLSLSGFTRADPDLVFAATAGQSFATTISSPGAAWSNIFSGSQGSTSTDNSIALRTDWAAFAPLSNPSAAWTYGGTVGAAAAIMVGITVNTYLGVVPSPAPSQLGTVKDGIQNVAQMFPGQRPFFPRVIVEGAFGSSPGDYTAAILDDAWTDMSKFAIGKQGQQAITAIRGQQYELSTPESGSLTVALNNQAGDFNPAFPGSQFYSNSISSNPPVSPVPGNMSFQNGQAGFAPGPYTTSNGLKIQLSANNAYASGQGAVAQLALQLTPDGVNPAPTLTDTNLYQIDPNKRYVVSASVISAVGYATGMQVQVNWLDRWKTPITSASVAAVPVAAGVRTTVATASLIPPANTTFAQIVLFYTGTPPASAVVYASEFAISVGSLSTGLVRAGVPVRASCYWNGRRYPIGFGYAERWPQDWPDWPQWGWSNMIATDVVGVASSVNLPSAVQGEMLVDNPYYCFPFNEQYTSATAKALPYQGADGMFAINVAQANQKPAIYKNGVNKFTAFSVGQTTGNTDLIATGQSMGLLGDSGTGMGNSSDTTLSTTVTEGAGAIYGPDPNMPSGSQTYDLWITGPQVSSPPLSIINTKLMDIVCEQDQTNRSLGAGVLATLGLQYNTFNGNPTLFIATNSTVITTVFTLLPGQTTIINGTVFDLSSWHVQVRINTSLNQVAVLVNGQLWTTVSYSNPFSSPVAVTYGQCAYTTGLLYNTFQFAIAYGTLFPALIPAWRTWAHVQAGLTGFALDGTTDRALRYISWGGLNLGLAGPRDTISDLGPAYSVAGSSLASAINSDCAGFGSRWAGSANGNLVLLNRQAQYNQSTSIVFGDTPINISSPNLNQNPGFEYGLTGWTATNCTTSLVTAPVFSGVNACQLAFNGSSSGPRLTAQNPAGSVNIAVTPGNWYEFTIWLQSPQGLYSGTTASIDWYNGVTLLSTSSSAQATLLPGVWTPVVIVAQAPASANLAQCYASLSGTPSAAARVVVDLGTVRNAYEVIPYQPSQAFDYDNTYVNNQFQSSISIASATGAAPLVRDPTSVLQYFQRGPLAQSVNGTTPGDAYDQVNWNLNRYKQPSLRVRQLDVVPSASPYSFSNVLATDVGAIAFTSRKPMNATAYNTGPGSSGIPVVIQRVETRIGPGMWSTQYQQSPGAPQNTILQANSSATPGTVVANNSLAW